MDDVAQDTARDTDRHLDGYDGQGHGRGQEHTEEAGGLGRRLPLVAAVLAVLVVLLAAGLVVSLVAGNGPSQAAAPAAAGTGAATDPAGGPGGPATLYGRVVSVDDPGTITVEVAGQQVPFDVLGVDATTIPPCAQAGALAFARTTLDRQMVTLVPDPTVVQRSPRQAYVVLDRQLSYTDAIIQAGWVEPSGTALYRPVFDEERRAAESDGVGMFGRACGR